VIARLVTSPGGSPSWALCDAMDQFVRRQRRVADLVRLGTSSPSASVSMAAPLAREGGEGVAYGNGLVRRALCNKFSPEILGAHGSGLQRRVLSRLLLHFRRIPLTRTSLATGHRRAGRPAGAARTPRSGRGATLNFRQRELWIEDDVIMGGRPRRRRPSAYAPRRIRSCRPCR